MADHTKDTQAPPNGSTAKPLGALSVVKDICGIVALVATILNLLLGSNWIGASKEPSLVYRLNPLPANMPYSKVLTVWNAGDAVAMGSQVSVSLDTPLLSAASFCCTGGKPTRLDGTKGKRTIFVDGAQLFPEDALSICYTPAQNDSKTTPTVSVNCTSSKGVCFEDYFSQQKRQLRALHIWWVAIAVPLLAFLVLSAIQNKKCIQMYQAKCKDAGDALASVNAKECEVKTAHDELCEERAARARAEKQLENVTQQLSSGSDCSPYFTSLHSQLSNAGHAIQTCCSKTNNREERVKTCGRVYDDCIRLCMQFFPQNGTKIAGCVIGVQDKKQFARADLGTRPGGMSSLNRQAYDGIEGAAIDSGQIQICEDITKDNGVYMQNAFCDFEPKAAIAVPICTSSRSVGSLCFYFSDIIAADIPQELSSFLLLMAKIIGAVAWLDPQWAKRVRGGTILEGKQLY